MQSSYVTWVENWFNSPGSPTTPKDDRKHCFMAVSMLIGEFVNSKPSKEKLKQVHNLLTYLLLGTNPITNWKKHSDYPEPTTETACLTYDDLYESVKSLMDFSCEENTSRALQVLGHLTNICKQFKNRDVEFRLGEHISNMMLAPWMLCRSLKTPKDVGLIRACLDLYYRSEMLGSDTIDREYAHVTSVMKMLSWYETQTNRLIIMNNTKDLCSSVAYMSWFCSLIRAQRMMRCLISPDPEWINEISTIVNREITSLRQVLDENSLRLNEDQIPEGSNIRLSTRLFRLLRIHPPKVKIHKHE